MENTMEVPEHIKQKIELISSSYIESGIAKSCMEFGYSLAKQEIERLKGLIEDDLKHFWVANEYQDLIHSGHKAHTASEIAEAKWQQFKTENLL